EAAHDTDSLVDRGLNFFQNGYIGSQRGREGRQFLFNFLICFRIAIEHADFRAFFEEASSSGGADAAGASGDEDAFVFEAAHEERIINRGASVPRQIDHRLATSCALRATAVTSVAFHARSLAALESARVLRDDAINIVERTRCSG